MSKSFSLNRDDFKKILKGLAIACAGAGLTYLAGILDVIDVDPYSPLYVALLSAVVNALQKFVSGASTPSENN